MNSKPEAKFLPCLFDSFSRKYPESQLIQYETKSNQRWRYASSKVTMEKIVETAKYFPELSLLFDSLENYSICEKHYNQVVAKNSFIKQLTKNNLVFSELNETENKRLKLSENSKELFEKNFSEFGVQVCLPDPVIGDLLKRIKELETINKQLLIENEALKKKLGFTNQQDRIESVIEIAKKERNNLYKDIMSLMKNHERFSLDDLLEYSPSKWLVEQNLVIVKFIETLIYNENEYQLRGEKLFKCAIAIETIYGLRNLKYVSAINLAASAIKYSLARSKIIINIDNHIISSGGYTTFMNWLGNLAVEQPSLPKGLLFLAFDNEQKGQKNYLDRRYNTVIFYIVTSFVAFNYDQDIHAQITDPWLYSELTKQQYEELFYLNLGMENEIHEELTKYLSIILDELCTEKNQETNPIDELVQQQSQMGNMKKCTVCQTSNINNKKRVCPTCHNKLPTIAKINQQFVEQQNIIDTIKKPLVIHFHTFKESRLIPERTVHTPQIFIPDPIGINLNLIANVRKVLEHIEEIAEIKNRSHKWVVVTCDGVPYHHIQKIKKDFPWLILIPGALHEEMNMLRAFVELN
ncbi:hypothetical protein Glove_117g420 [Diversispora epigaea]|uniref:Uncharacterized protein n=1 Tax=Diversispora epigaea TaxID=1348612 RepID=A0A397J4F2_9GLOM|nr:hypothetical protein Glove_117g420 [Diversispora epigaea]